MMSDHEKLIEEARRFIRPHIDCAEFDLIRRLSDALESVEKALTLPDGFRRSEVPEPQGEPDALCGDWPAPCNCDDPTTHDGSVPASLVQGERGEPSDAELLKLANDAHHRMVDEAESDGGWYGFSHSRDAWEDGFATGYRARAASSVTEQGEAEKPRCGGGRTHCRHDQWPPMHSMACPISKAAVTEQGENR